MPANAASTPAAPNSPMLIPAFFADRPISALASSISLRTSVETSAIALWTRVPTDGSSGPGTRTAGDVVPGARTAGDVLDALETLWATGGSSFDGTCWSGDVLTGES